MGPAFDTPCQGSQLPFKSNESKCSNLRPLPPQEDDEGEEDEGGQLQGAARLVSEVRALKRARHAATPDASAMAPAIAHADSDDGAAEWALEGGEDEAGGEEADDDEDDDDLPEAAAHRCCA